MINRIVALYDQYRGVGLAMVHVEANLAFFAALEAEQRRLNKFFHVEPLKPQGVSKADRILAFVQLAQIRFAANNPGVSELISELCGWSVQATIDDLPDALAYLRKVAFAASGERSEDAPKWVPEITKRVLKAMQAHQSGPDFSMRGRTQD